MECAAVCQAMDDCVMGPMKDVEIYTDGACLGNPGPGAYCALIVFNGQQKSFSAGYRRTTNNRMEIMAAIAGLEALKEKCRVVLFSDSQYLVKAMKLGWAESWRKRGWKRNAKEMAVNPDLWQRLLDVCQKHEVEFRWLEGHAGHAGNEFCDNLANKTASLKNLPPDLGYEKAHPGLGTGFPC